MLVHKLFKIFKKYSTTSQLFYKQRRSRMIMVEGKLQSWGRAETVLKILDIDVAGKKLEATLEDIVEAVYNCGDRQSSLVYLQQECQCCFTYFPMSKVCVFYMNISIHQFFCIVPRLPMISCLNF